MGFHSVTATQFLRERLISPGDTTRETSEQKTQENQAAVSSATAWDVQLNPNVSALVDGEAEGVLYGGCLSILVASLGTPFSDASEHMLIRFDWRRCFR